MTQSPPDQELVFDPRGNTDATPQPLAPRPQRLQGRSLGVLDNTKWNAGKLLRRIAARLEAEDGLGEIRFYAKESFSRAADPQLLDEIARDCDLVITAIGD